MDAWKVIIAIRLWAGRIYRYTVDFTDGDDARRFYHRWIDTTARVGHVAADHSQDHGTALLHLDCCIGSSFAGIDAVFCHYDGRVMP